MDDDEKIEESNCEKWGKNQEKEWHERWGEIHRNGQKQKWSDKWVIEHGVKRGENWGQNYTDDY